MRISQCVDLVRRPRGTTLLELMIAVAIFGVLITAVFGIFNLGSRHWKVIENRNALQNEIRRVQTDLATELERSTWGTFQGSTLSGIAVRQVAGDYRYAICMQTAINPASKIFDVDPANSEPICHGFILYYIIRPPDDTCPPPTSPDHICPHKWLIRKDIDLAAAISSSSDLVTYLNTDLTLGGNVRGCKKLAQNVLAFSVNVDYPLSPVVDFNIKSLKEVQFRSVVGTGEDLTGNPNLTLQVDNRVIPRN